MSRAFFATLAVVLVMSALAMHFADGDDVRAVVFLGCLFGIVLCAAFDIIGRRK